MTDKTAVARRASPDDRTASPPLISPLGIQRVWMVTSGIVAAILILTVYLVIASRFTATAQIAFDAGAGTIPVERLEAFVASPARIGRTVDRLGLAAPLGTGQWAPPEEPATARRSAIERIAAGLRVEQTDLTNVFVLRYSGGLRRLVAPVVNDLADGIVRAGARPSPIRARIVTPASDPDTPDGSLFAPIAVALLGGVLAAVVTFGVRERLQAGLRSPASAERMLGLPVTGMIPVVQGIPAGERGALTALPATAPQSDYAHAFRRILAPGRPIARTIAVCSALAGEGKSTFAISLARTAALQGRRVAFVDCDARVRAASMALDVATQPGLIEIVDGAIALEDALIFDRHSPLMILGHSNGAEIRSFWAKDAMAGLRGITETLAETFDLVVIDTPPLLALVEAREIAGLADEALLIARWRGTPIPALRLAVKLLAEKDLRSSLVLSFVRFAKPARRAGRASSASRSPFRQAVGAF